MNFLLKRPSGHARRRASGSAARAEDGGAGAPISLGKRSFRVPAPARPQTPKKPMVANRTSATLRRMFSVLFLAACTDYNIRGPIAEPVALTLTSPSYGEFLGDGPIRVTGTVSPVDAAVLVDGNLVVADKDGAFTTTVEFTDRAQLIDVTAHKGSEEAREIVPVFDGNDPRLTDPGAIAGLLTPTGLDALEPVVGDMIDQLGWEDQLFAALPAIDTAYFSLTPTSITSSGTTVDLAPAADAVTLSVTLHDVAIAADVDVAGWAQFPMTITLGEVSVGADAIPALADDMLTLELSAATADMGDIGLSVDGFDIPDWLMQLIVDPIAGLVADGAALLVDVLLDQFGAIELGGPFAFDIPLLDTTLSAKLADVHANLSGVNLGATVGYDAPAPDEMPDVAALPPTTRDGTPYQLGAAVHEGMLNVVMDETLAGFVDLDLQLDGAYGEMLGAGIAALPGGGQIPENATGYCIGLHTGAARVVRMVEGTGDPLARAYLPDLQVNIDVVQEGQCNAWLDAQLFGVVNLGMKGTEVSADFDIKQAIVLDYGATGVDDADVGEKLGGVVEGLAGLLAGNLSFDLGGLLDIGGLALNPRVVSIEALDEDGRYGVYLDVF